VLVLFLSVSFLGSSVRIESVVNTCSATILLWMRVVEHATAVCKTYEDKADALRAEFLHRSMRRKLMSLSVLKQLNNEIFFVLCLLFYFGVGSL